MLENSAGGSILISQYYFILFFGDCFLRHNFVARGSFQCTNPSFLCDKLLTRRGASLLQRSLVVAHLLCVERQNGGHLSPLRWLSIIGLISQKTDSYSIHPRSNASWHYCLYVHTLGTVDGEYFGLIIEILETACWSSSCCLRCAMFFTEVVLTGARMCGEISCACVTVTPLPRPSS